jgi:hypothetical protein
MELSDRLRGMRRGIEKESLRVRPDGTLAQTLHPPALGAALTHAHITTDFSEAQLELITGPRTSVRLACRLFRRAFWQILLVTVVLYAAPNALADRFLLSHSLRLRYQAELFGAIQLLFGTIGLTATARLLLQAAHERPIDLSEALFYGCKRWPSGAAAGFIVSFFIGAGLILLLVPGILAALQYCLVLPLLAATRLGAGQTLELSKQLVEGRRLALFRALGTAFVIAGLPWLAIEVGISASGVLDAPAAWWLAPLLLAGETALGLCQAFFVAAQVACYQQVLAYSGAYQGVTETTI